MDCNLDVVRGLPCLFDPEGSAESGGQANGSPLETEKAFSVTWKSLHYERTNDINIVITFWCNCGVNFENCERNMRLRYVR